MKQPWAWVSWLIATIVILSITRNPLYLVLILMCILFVGLNLQQTGSDMPRPFSLWKLAAWIIILATIFNALTSHYGETILFTIPGKLPLISGRVTLEAMLYGATNGLVLTGMLASFTVLNLALPVRDLISLIPRAFFPVAVVTSIAVTYQPTTLRQFQQIREAQAVRGHQMRTLRDWLPLWMPLLVGGLEHAMQLAEAMTARGFASTRPVRHGWDIYPRLGLVLGLVLLAIGWLAQLGGAGAWGLVLILSGVLLIVGGLWFLGRQSPRTAYHRPRWTWQDGLTIIVAMGVIVICVLPLTGLDQQTLYYEPYPTLTLPPFSPLLGVAMLALILPGLLRENLGRK
jgi:energy-coupling factor transport system permease protein